MCAAVFAFHVKRVFSTTLTTSVGMLAESEVSPLLPTPPHTLHLAVQLLYELAFPRPPAFCPDRLDLFKLCVPRCMSARSLFEHTRRILRSPPPLPPFI